MSIAAAYLENNGFPARFGVIRTSRRTADAAVLPLFVGRTLLVIAHAEQEIHRKIVDLCDEIEIFGGGLFLPAPPIGHAGGSHADVGGKLSLRDLLLPQKLRQTLRKLIVHTDDFHSSVK